MINTETRLHHVLTTGTAVLQQDTDKRPRSYLAAGLFVGILLYTCYPLILKKGVPTGS